MPTTPELCPYCGKRLIPRVIEIAGQTLSFGFQLCGCPESVAEEERLVAEDRAREDAEQERLFWNRVARSGIPERYWKAELEGPDDERLHGAALSRGLYLWGDPGRGKTHKAAAIGLEALRRNASVRFVKAAYLTSMLSGFDRYDEALYAITSPSLLIIDDLGMEAVNDWSNAKARQAIDARHDCAKPVIITANYSLPELADRMEKDSRDMTIWALISRLAGMTEAVEIVGEDRRNHAA